MCARSRGSQHDAMLSGVTLRDGNDRRVFMQNFKSWYLMSGSEQTRICSPSLQMVPVWAITVSRNRVTAPVWRIGVQRTVQLSGAPSRAVPDGVPSAAIAMLPCTGNVMSGWATLWPSPFQVPPIRPAPVQADATDADAAKATAVRVMGMVSLRMQRA